MAKVGTKKRPAVVRVATEERAYQIMDLCNRQGIQVIVGIEPDKPEDTSDIERALRRAEPAKAAKAPPRITGNDYCPCGSEKKYKKCCGAAAV
jgi:SWIM/SEC-C metal-binding protein